MFHVVRNRPPAPAYHSAVCCRMFAERSIGAGVYRRGALPLSDCLPPRINRRLRPPFCVGFQLPIITLMRISERTIRRRREPTEQKRTAKGKTFQKNGVLRRNPNEKRPKTDQIHRNSNFSTPTKTTRKPTADNRQTINFPEIKSRRSAHPANRSRSASYRPPRSFRKRALNSSGAALPKACRRQFRKPPRVAAYTASVQMDRRASIISPSAQPIQIRRRV